MRLPTNSINVDFWNDLGTLLNCLEANQLSEAEANWGLNATFFRKGNIFPFRYRGN